MKLHPSGQLQISGLARASIKALGFLHSGSCVLQDFPSPEQMGCHINNHEADDRYRLRGLIWETDHKTTTPSFCHLFPQTGGSASLRNSKPQPMPLSDIIQTCSQNRCLISSHLLLTTSRLMINIIVVPNEHYTTVDEFHVGSRHRQKPTDTKTKPETQWAWVTKMSGTKEAAGLHPSISQWRAPADAL